MELREKSFQVFYFSYVCMYVCIALCMVSSFVSLLSVCRYSGVFAL